MRRVPFRFLLPIVLGLFALAGISKLLAAPDWLVGAFLGAHVTVFIHGAYRGLFWILAGKEGLDP